jgi:hypothetical protein
MPLARIPSALILAAACGLQALAGTVLAQTAAAPASAPARPHSLVASPDIYEVLAEDTRYRVILVTWKPGQKDVMHSHPASGVYYLNDCSLRNHVEDGSYTDGKPKAGMARVQPPIRAHVIENVGTAECKLVMFEPVN